MSEKDFQKGFNTNQPFDGKGNWSDFARGRGMQQQQQQQPSQPAKGFDYSIFAPTQSGSSGGSGTSTLSGVFLSAAGIFYLPVTVLATVVSAAASLLFLLGRRFAGESGEYPFGYTFRSFWIGTFLYGFVFVTLGWVISSFWPDDFTRGFLYRVAGQIDQAMDALRFPIPLDPVGAALRFAVPVLSVPAVLVLMAVLWRRFPDTYRVHGRRGYMHLLYSGVATGLVMTFVGLWMVLEARQIF